MSTATAPTHRYSAPHARHRVCGTVNESTDDRGREGTHRGEAAAGEVAAVASSGSSFSVVAGVALCDVVAAAAVAAGVACGLVPPGESGRAAGSERLVPAAFARISRRCSLSGIASKVSP